MNKLNTLPPQWYYTLEQASQKMGDNIKLNYLLHLGATGRLELVAKIPRDIMVVVKQHGAKNEIAGTLIGNNGKTSLQLPFDNPSDLVAPIYQARFITLSYLECATLEAFNNVRVSASGQLWTFDPIDNAEKEVYPIDLGHFPKLSYTSFVCNLKGSYRTGNPAPKELIADSSTVYILRHELERLIDSQIMTKNQKDRIKPRDQDTPHGNAERFAVNRERVLKVAIACKLNYPDECNGLTNWAKTIDQKWMLFYKDQLEPPLKPAVIENLLSEAQKLPD